MIYFYFFKFSRTLVSITVISEIIYDSVIHPYPGYHPSTRLFQVLYKFLIVTDNVN